ncbi:hypothetical protein ARMSODRAFT_1071471 [Armillaria solidipes]|uniref:Uncharacterized protein n=1 Tax=Armillaria solidipes TaxID=1076256 RepID=A0A2H3AXD5_9AGAR|nr:hypothetical protein ARMSODRAFT_1071471 [Armillaria solidipes]
MALLKTLVKQQGEYHAFEGDIHLDSLSYRDIFKNYCGDVVYCLEDYFETREKNSCRRCCYPWRVCSTRGLDASTWNFIAKMTTVVSLNQAEDSLCKLFDKRQALQASSISKRNKAEIQRFKAECIGKADMAQSYKESTREEHPKHTRLGSVHLTLRRCSVLAEHADIGVVTSDQFINRHDLPRDFQSQMYIGNRPRGALFSEQLRQPTSIPLSGKEDYVEKCNQLCGLEPFRDTTVGSLSIEYRKRTTIGVELAAKTMDRPFCAQLFQMFDRLLLLRNGGETTNGVFQVLSSRWCRGVCGLETRLA